MVLEDGLEVKQNSSGSMKARMPPLEETYKFVLDLFVRALDVF